MFFCQPSGSILHSKNDLHTVPSGKVQNAHLFGPIVLAATASSWCWRRFKWWCHGPSNQIYTWTKRRRRWVVARAQQSACESAHTKVSALQSNFPTTQCRRHTNTWSTSIKKKNAVSSPYHAGLFCNRVLRLWVRFVISQEESAMKKEDMFGSLQL